MIFTRNDYDALHALVFADHGDSVSGPVYFPGYRPHGDGRIAHVTLKYIENDVTRRLFTAEERELCMYMLARAYSEACRVAEMLGVRPKYYPRMQDGTLRILEYPAGVGSEEHTDFDLFTVPCFRDDAECRDPRLHIGELGELVGLGAATPHRVVPREHVQRAIVYLAMPAPDARLPCTTCSHEDCGFGLTVAEWLVERKSLRQ